MQQITITEFSDNLVKHFNYVESERKGVVVTQENHESCVVVPLSAWEGMNETLYLLETKYFSNEYKN
jgi:prevent-host-death family protein